MDFTIVTPSRNYGHFIGDCLASVAAQDGVRLEHLVMDACSTDHTAEVVGRFPHATLRSEPDKGMTDAINKGFRRASGEWVMWLNADDRLKPGALRAVKEFARNHPEADIIHGGWDYMDASGVVTRTMPALPFDFRILVQQGCYIGSTACFLRRGPTIDQGHLLDDRFGFCMDGEYYARLAHAGKRFVAMPAILADFRIHDGSISQGHLGKPDLGSLLAFQRQAAEPRAIRRLYGIRPFRDEHLSLAVDGLLYHLYRLKKGLLRALHGRHQAPPSRG